MQKESAREGSNRLYQCTDLSLNFKPNSEMENSFLSWKKIREMKFLTFFIFILSDLCLLIKWWQVNEGATTFGI